MNSKIYSIFTILLLYFSSIAYPQDTGKNTLSAISTFNMFHDPSYITILGGIGNLEPLIFEADIVPYYTLSINRKARWAIEISPRILFRMYNSESYPVRTPSFMPRITFFYNIIDKTDNKRDWFAYFSWYHHSNGQDGSFFNADSCTINTLSGNFATNFFEGGTFISRPDKKRPFIINYHKISFSYCYHQSPELKPLYGRFRLFYDYNTSLNINSKTNHKSYLIQSLKLGWIAGDFAQAKSFDSKRIVFRYTLSYRPSFLEDISIFAQYYYGQDYYNIYFNRTLHVLRFGIAAKMSINY
ncbi:MAG: hypothetical protein ABFC28_03315 [Rikenellaceae bacterium]